MPKTEAPIRRPPRRHRNKTRRTASAVADQVGTSTDKPAFDQALAGLVRKCVSPGRNLDCPELVERTLQQVGHSAPSLRAQRAPQ
jgi:hypothetical protein